jgi:hypothetical protein
MKGKGFVKTAEETNAAYVAEWENDSWYPAIKDAHDLLSHFIPGYQITQIKEKFGGLRYYYVVPVDDLPHDERELYVKLANHIVTAAEVECANIDRQLAARKRVADREAAMAAEEEE